MSVITPYIPALGILSGGITTSRYVFTHLTNKVGDAAAKAGFENGEGNKDANPS